jgi:hypothetical protein
MVEGMGEALGLSGMLVPVCQLCDTTLQKTMVLVCVQFGAVILISKTQITVWDIPGNDLC